MKNPRDVVSGFKHDNRLKCRREKVSQWTFQVGLNVTVNKTWVDVTSRHRFHQCRKIVSGTSIALLHHEG
jgi:hypothetical protein